MKYCVIVVAILVSACVPRLEIIGAPCDGKACAAGFSCCQGSCIAAEEQCVGRCLEPSDERFMPFAVDSVWTYDVINTSTRQFDSIKKLRLGAEESLAPWGDGVAQRLCREDRNTDDGINAAAIRWEEDLGDAAVWRRNLRIDASGPTKDELPTPSAMRIDESADRVCVGARYRTDWVERVIDPPNCATYATGDPSDCVSADNDVIEEWFVDAIDAPVDVVGVGIVPCLQVTRTMTTVAEIEVTTFWFARGIGKVQEVNPAEETEELLFFSIPDGLSGGVDVGAPIGRCDPEWWPLF